MLTSGYNSPQYQPTETHDVDSKTPNVRMQPLSSPSDTPPLVRWGIGWRAPVTVAILIAASFGTAIGHHVYYQRLNHTAVISKEQQTWAIRIGTGLAFLNKTLILTTMSLAATQLIWLTLRRKPMTLRGIDSMFSIMNDPGAVFDPQLWTRAKTLMLLATMSWFIPLIAIVTPATLSIKLETTVTTNSQSVPTANYSSLAGWATFEGAGRIDKPTFEITRLFSSVFTSASYLTSTPSYPNSTYELNFWGPSYKCLGLNETLAEHNSPTWDTDTYNYSSLRNVWDELVLPNLTGPQNQYRAYSAVAPSFLNNMILIWSAGWYNKSSLSTSSGTGIVCQLYNTSYDISMRFDQGVQSIVPLSIQHLEPFAWNANTGSTSQLDGNFTLGTSYVTHILFSDLLTGNVTVGSTGSLGGTATMLLQSGLVSCPDFWNSTQLRSLYSISYSDFPYCRNKTLGSAIEDLSMNFTYSTIASNYGREEATAKVPVTIKSPHNIYSYDMRNLLIAYGVGILAMLVWAGVGIAALLSNGVISSTSFSTILLTTRNADFDRMAEGNSLGADPLPKSIGREKLMFGRLNGEGCTNRAGFGFKGTVTQIYKGEELR